MLLLMDGMTRVGAARAASGGGLLAGDCNIRDVLAAAHDGETVTPEMIEAYERRLQQQWAEPAPVQGDRPARKLYRNYTVSRGDTLWNISGTPAGYNDPFQWPRIHCDNREKIADPDLIQPGQRLRIESRAHETGAEAPATPATRDDANASEAPDTSDVLYRLLSARVNGQRFDRATRMLQTTGHGLLVSRESLERWGLAVPDTIEPIKRDGTVLYPLRRFDRLDYSIDEASQTLVVNAGAQQFGGSSIDLGRAQLRTPRADAVGGFLNYDVIHESRDSAEDTTSGTVEFGAFNQWGVATTTLLARDRRRDDGVVRLNTTLRHDEPAEMRTLTLGDTFSRPGAWGRTVQYGGIQWGTNFGTQPDFTTVPLPDVTGETTVPTSIEIYANERRRGDAQFGAGPFSVQNIPVVTGTNDVRLVVRDVLGRERIIERSFYASPQLLRDGLHDYTYEAGVIRENFTRRSNDYGRGFAAATHRLGLTEDFTGEMRLEVLADQQTAGVGGSWLAGPGWGVVSGAVAASTSEGGGGGFVNVGIQRRDRRFSFQANTTRTSENFRQLGLREDEAAPKEITSASFGTRLGSTGSIGVSYAGIERRDEVDTRIANASYSMALGRGAALNLFASQELDRHNTSVGLTLSVALGTHTSASTGHTRDEGRSGNSIQLQRNPPRGTGIGYRVAAEDGPDVPSRSQARITARTDYGSYHAEAARFRGDTAWRVGAAGGTAFLGGNAFLARQVDDSFAVVEVGDYEGVRVYNDNQSVARTNANGAALVPDIRSFEDNRLSFEQADLPLDARLEGRDATVVPGHRRGVLVEFVVDSPNGALLTVHRANGEPVPAGATVSRVGGDQRFPVGRRGEVWVTDLEPKNRFEARWGDQRCHFETKMPANPGPMRHIGPLLCREVDP